MWSTDKSLTVLVHYLLSFCHGAVAQFLDSVLSPGSGTVTLHDLESWEFRAIDRHVLGETLLWWFWRFVSLQTLVFSGSQFPASRTSCQSSLRLLDGRSHDYSLES
jgi:hypothetical protein